MVTPWIFVQGGESEEHAYARKQAQEELLRQQELAAQQAAREEEAKKSTSIDWNNVSGNKSPLTGRTPEEIDRAIKSGENVSSAESAWAAGYRNFPVGNVNLGNVNLGDKGVTLSPRELLPGPDSLTKSERKFEVQPDWKPVQYDAQGKVIVYTDTKGMQWYTPYSVQWQQGYKHEESGVHSEFPVDDAPYVSVLSDSGDLTHITKKESALLEKLKKNDPEGYIKKLSDIGVLPDDAEYISGKGDDISYTTTASQRQEKEEYDKAYKVLLKAGAIVVKGDETNIDVKKATESEDTATENALIYFGVSPETIASIKNDRIIDSLYKKSDAKLKNYINENGTLNLTGSVDAGYTKVTDYLGWNVSPKDIEDTLSILKHNKEQRDALSALSDAKNNDGTYDFDKLASFARTHDNYALTLTNADFEDALKNDIKDYNEAPLSIDEYKRRRYEDLGVEEPAIGKYSTKFSHMLHGQTELEEKINNEYKEKYGIKAYSEEMTAEAVTPMFPPARSLRVDTSLKDITPVEWATGIAQIALFSLPMIGGAGSSVAGRIASISIQGGSAGIFTYSTVKNWDDMSGGERCIAVAIDTLLIAGAAKSAGIDLGSLKSKASVVTDKALNKLAQENGGVIKIKAISSQISKSLGDGDINRLVNAGKKLENQGKSIESKAIELQGKYIQDHAAEIIKLAEQRLTIKQSTDLISRLGNNLDFIESPGQKLIENFQRLESDITKTRKQIADNESLIKKSDYELESKPKTTTKPSGMSHGEVEAEKVRLSQQISRDNADLYELRNKGGELRDMHELEDRIQQSREELARLETQSKHIDTGKIKQEAQNEIKSLNRQLAAQVKQRNDLLKSDAATQLWGTKITGQTPKEPVERGGQPLETGGSPPEKSARVGTIEKVERKVEVREREKVKEVEPDIDKLKKAREKVGAERLKPKTSRETGTRTQTDTERQVTINIPTKTGISSIPFIISYPFNPTANPEKAKEYERQIRSTELVRVSPQGAFKLQPDAEEKLKQLLKSMPAQKALGKLAEAYPAKVNSPIFMPQSKAQAITQPAATKTQTMIKIKTMPETVTKLKSLQITKTSTKPKPYQVTKVKTIEGEKNKVKIKLSKGNDSDNRSFIENSDAAVAYRRGELGGQDVWHTWVKYGNQWHRVIVMGQTPEGANIATGPKSAYLTIQKLGRGSLKQNFFEDTGAVDTRITSAGGKPIITFHRDLNVSERAPRISSNRLRISPKMPRLK